MSSIFETGAISSTTMNRNTIQAMLQMESAKSSETEGSYLEKYIKASTEKLKTEDADAEEKTADAVKDEEENENYLQKFFKASFKKLSPENNKLSSYSVEVSDSVKRLENVIEKDEKAESENKDDITGAAKDLVNSFNKLAEQIRDSGSGTVSGKSDFISNMTKAYSQRLEKVGITRNDDGTLSIDEEKLKQASPKDIERAFGKKDSFASFIDEQARQLATYAQSDIFSRAGAYSNAGNITTVSNINGAFMNMMG